MYETYRCSFLLAALAAITLTGCLPPSVSVPYSVWSDVWFTPDERRVLVHGPAETSVYYISARRVLWRLRTGPGGDIALSASGAYFALARDATPPGAASIALFRLSSGERLLFAHVDHPAKYITEFTSQLVDISDDEKWLAIATEPPGERQHSVVLQPMDRSASVSLTEAEHGVASIAFEPGGQRLAVAWRGRAWRIVVYGRTDDRWTPIATLNQASCPTWVRGGLGFVSNDGFGRWDGRVARTFLRGLVEPGDDFERCNHWRFSDDGAYLVEWDTWRLTAHDTRSGSPLVNFEWSHDEPAGVCGAAFLGARFRAFVCSGTFVELDLAARREVRTVSFGSPGSYERTLFGEGASYTANYDAYLSPRGTYVDIVYRGRGHVLYNMD